MALGEAGWRSTVRITEATASPAMRVRIRLEMSLASATRARPTSHRPRSRSPAGHQPPPVDRHVRERPFPDICPILNPRRIDVLAARRGGFSGRVSHRKPERRRARARMRPAPASGRIRGRRSGDARSPSGPATPAFAQERGREPRCRRRTATASAVGQRAIAMRDERQRTPGLGNQGSIRAFPMTWQSGDVRESRSPFVPCGHPRRREGDDRNQAEAVARPATPICTRVHANAGAVGGRPKAARHRPLDLTR
jgi:hypothetical protein